LGPMLAVSCEEFNALPALQEPPAGLAVRRGQEFEIALQALQEPPTGTAVGKGLIRCSRHAVVGVAATICVLLLGSGAWFATGGRAASSAATGAGTGVAVPHTAMMRSMMQASQFMQSCSSKCNWKLDAGLKGCKVGERGCPKDAHHQHATCCSKCQGGKCTYPCSEVCNQEFAKAVVKCKPGVIGCQKPAAHTHKQCCLKCPLAKCTPARPTEDDFKLANATVSVATNGPINIVI